MTTRIVGLAYWVITLYAAVASGQNFDRLLNTRDYGMATRNHVAENYGADSHAAKRPVTQQAYRAGVRDATRAARDYANFDYPALRDQVSRQYADEFRHTARPLLPAQTPPTARDYERQNDRAPYGYESRPTPEALRDRAWHERELRRAFDSDRPHTESHGRCPHGDCSGNTGFQPIGYDYPHASGCSGYGSYGYGGPGVAPAGFFDGPQGPEPRSNPRDYRAYRQNVDRDGNYVSDNLFGDPRIFNPDQPVRNLLRYVFP